MAKKKNEARMSYELYESFRRNRAPWISEVKTDYDYYWGKQWTDQQKKELAIRGKAPLVFNIIGPHIDTKKSIITAQSPSFRCVPRGDEDVGIAQVWNNMLSYIWYHSSGQLQFQQAIHDYCVAGVGWLQADVDPFADDGHGEVVVRYVPYNFVYPDPTCLRKDFSDSRRIIVSMRLPRETAIFMYPDQKEKILKVHSDSETDWEGVGMQTTSGIITPNDYDYNDEKTEDYVRIIERYEVSQHEMLAVYLPDRLEPVYMTPKEYKNGGYADNGLVEADEVYKKRCRRVVSVGESAEISDELMSVSDYPLIPMVNIHTMTPYPHGDVRYLRDPQDEKNKRRMVIIHHAMSAGTNRTIAPRGSVDVPEWERKASIPGGVLEYDALPGIEAPKAFPVEQLPSALFHMEETSMRDAEYIDGIYPTMMGNPTDAPETYRATLMLEETGTRRIRGNDLATVEHALGRLGKVVLEMGQSLYTAEKIIRVIGENGKMAQHVVNVPVMDQSGTIIRTTNDLSIGQFDVVCIGGSTLPTNRMAQLEMYEQWHDKGIVDREAVIRKADIPDAEEILARMSEVAQLTGALEQQGEEIKSLQGLLQTLKRQMMQQDMKITEKEFELLKQAELIALQAQAKVAKALMSQRAEGFTKELNSSKKAILANSQVKAAAELSVLSAQNKPKAEGE